MNSYRRESPPKLAFMMITYLHLFLLSSFVYCKASSAQKTDGTTTMHFDDPTGESTPALLPEEEAHALKDLLYEGFGDNRTVNRSFCLETDSSTNINVSCSRTSGNIFHIVGIFSLSSQPSRRYVGSSSSSNDNEILQKVANLTFLENLTLSENQLTGSIPSIIGNLHFLQQMDLSGNQLTGSMPSTIANLSSLRLLDLSRNQLTGCIPSTIGNLSSLQNLDLSENNLTGNIPATIGKLYSLRELDISLNQLIGIIPPTIEDLQSLQELNLYNNLLQGGIPTLKNLVQLTTLDLSVNNLSGLIPDSLGNLVMLDNLYLDDNRLSGSLPKTLGNLTNLRSFDVGSNFLTGEIPKTFNQLASMLGFGAYGNRMSGEITGFTNWTRLQALLLGGNNFDGPLPDTSMMGNLNALSVTDLKSNNGYFPFPRINHAQLGYLELRNCSISGKIPSDIGKFTSLYYLDLSFNKLSGAIPSSLHNLSLDTILLNDNHLIGEIPRLNPAWRVGDFSFNEFTNGIQDQHVNCFNCSATENVSKRVSPQHLITTEFCSNNTEITSLHINCGGDNETMAITPYERDNSTSMFHVNENWAYSCSGSSSTNFTRNLSCGSGIDFSNSMIFTTARFCPISLKYYGLCFRNGKYNVTLYFAEIEYNNNKDYSSLNKRIFDIYIQRQLMVKDFNIVEAAGEPNKDTNKSFSQVDVTDRTLEIQLYWAGKGTLDNNGVLISGISVIPYESPESGINPLEISMIAIACIVFLGLLVLALAWQQGWIGDKSLYEKRIDIRGKMVSIKQLIKATQNFSPKKEIGKGGFGTVYMAQLTGQVIAIKKLSPRSKQGVEEFRRELFSLKSLRHKNFVELFDAYSGHGYHLLIYEYMENKSLADVLFDPNSKQKLNWETRYKICKDIVVGLKYLHEETHLRIIHGDIKATNILLDGACNGKISDFGLAKVYLEDDPSTVVKVGGTTGYMAPEYATQGILTHKADVYSFGVVLLEIISGKKNVQYKQQQESEFLLDTAYVLHKKGRIIDLVDPDLRDCLREKESHHQAKSLLFLAMMCTSLSHSLRPTMSEVLSMLEGEKSIEQISDDHSSASTSTSALTLGNISERQISQKNWTSSDVSPTSTDVSSYTATAYFTIKDKDEKKDEVLPSSTLEISHESRMN